MTFRVEAVQGGAGSAALPMGLLDAFMVPARSAPSSIGVEAPAALLYTATLGGALVRLLSDRLAAASSLPAIGSANLRCFALAAGRTAALRREGGAGAVR